MNDFFLVENFIKSYNPNCASDWVKTIDEQKPFGLNFSHLYHSIFCDKKITSFYGKRILEMGGALPTEYVFQILRPKTWTAVEYLGYNENQLQGNDIKNHQNYIYDNRGWKAFYETWTNKKQEKFDIVYSISAFEHIYNLGECIDAIYDMLDFGGQLYSSFTPIWSGKNGSHGFFPKALGAGNSHEHLTHDFISMQNALINTHGLPSNIAYKKAHDVYKSDQINRYTYEEYLQIFEQSKFEHKRINAVNLKNFQELYSEFKVNQIVKKYPGMKKSCDGFVILFTKQGHK